MPIYGQNYKKNGTLGVHFYTILVGTQISTVEPLTAKRSGRGADRRHAATTDTKEGTKGWTLACDRLWSARSSGLSPLRWRA